MTLINSLDFIAALLIGIGIFFVPKNYRYWLVYLLGCAVFVVLFAITKLYNTMVLEIVLAGVSLKNYLDAKKKDIPKQKGKMIATCGHELKNAEDGITTIKVSEFKDGKYCEITSVVCPKCYLKTLKKGVFNENGTQH